MYVNLSSISKVYTKTSIPLLTPTFLLALLRSLLLLPCRRTEKLLNLTHTLQIQPRAHKHNCEIEEDIHPKDAIVSPHVLPMHIERRRKGIAISVLTESAETVCLSDDIASGLLRVGSGVGIAGLAWGSWEGSEFLGVAFDGEAVGYESEKALEEVFERGEPVHPAAPEVGEGLVGYYDSAERYDEEEEHWH
jgi:hypothetical protein